MPFKTATASREYWIPNYTKESAPQNVQQWITAPQVKGTWITFPDGSRFRRPTNYYRSEYIYEPGSGYDFRARRISNGTRYDIVSGPGGNTFGNFFGGNWIYSYSGLGIPNLLANPALVTSETNEANTKSLNKLADGKAQIGENLATLGQTMRMFINPLQAYDDAILAIAKNKSMIPLLRKSYRDLIRGGTSKKLADQYLIYVYGFKPLMQDIYSLSELAKEQGGKPLFVHGQASVEKFSRGDDRRFLNTTAGVYEDWHSNVTRSRTRTVVWAKLSEQYQLARTLNQLGLLNPASLFWELVPFSFLIDWILPIGPVLSAITAPAGLDFVGGSTSRRVTSYWDCSILHVPAGSGYSDVSNTPGSGKFRYNGYTRNALSTWPKPGLYFDSDPLRLNADGSDRIFKGLALAISRMPSLR